MSLHIRNEDEFQHYVTEWKYHPMSLAHEFYPKVRRIGGEPISPDIDLLTIMEGRDKMRLICAYEFKFLRNKKIEENYRRIHEGIGEALSTLRYGVDRSYLVVGMSSLVSHVKTKIVEKLEYYTKILEKLQHFGILIWFENADSGMHFIKPPNEEATLAARFEDIELYRRNLLAGKISYDKKFNLRYEGFQYWQLKMTALEFAVDKISLSLKNLRETVVIKEVNMNKKKFEFDTPLGEDLTQVLRIDYKWRPYEILDIFVRTSNNEVTQFRKRSPIFAPTEDETFLEDCSD